METKDYNERIAELRREIFLRDNRIEELEQQLVFRQNIINKQGVLLAMNCIVWHDAVEEPETGNYLCSLHNKQADAYYIDVCLYSGNKFWVVPDGVEVLQWATIPRLGLGGNNEG